MAVTLVAALDRDRAIGRGNALPWHLPADLKHFKAITLGHPILMGRRTAEAIGRPLPGRRNLVLTRRQAPPFDGVELVHAMDAALAAIAPGDDLMVIGGGEVYALAMPHATRLVLTHVDTVVEGADAFFPAWDASGWQCVARVHHAANGRHAFDFEIAEYVRSA